ncbi:MAG: mannosyltransferase [Phycisphaerales bacterium]|jgi:mannosyltransferase|nr:mannosyltransferase [Phycisphaerales bacterium]
MTRPSLFTARVWRSLPILLILVLAAALRFRGIADDSLWGDEALSWIIARMSFVEMIRHIVWWEQIPPVHHVLLWVWIKVFGASELSLRMPSALAGVGGVAAMYVFVRRVLGRREAIAAALIVAVAPLHVAYAQEARTYALTFFVAIVCTDLFVRLLREPTQRLQVAYIIAAAVLLYCHLYGVFVLAAHQLAYACALMEKNKPALPLRRWIMTSIAIAALYSPWVSVVLGWVRAVNVNFWVKAVTWDDVSRAYWVLVGSTPLYLIAIPLAVLGVVRLWRRHRAAMPLLLGLAFLPVIVPVAVSILGRPSFAPRYAIVACVGLYPLIASGVAAIPFGAARAGLLVLFAALAIHAARGEATAVPKSPWREAVAYVQERAGPKDIVVIHIGAKKRLYDYYNRRPELPVRRFDSESLPLVPPIDPGRHVWFIRHEEWALLPAQIRRGPWHIISHKWFGDILVMEMDDQFPPDYEDPGRNR